MSSYAQRDLFGTPQPDLFEDAPAAQKPYQVNPQHIRNRFIDFLEQMRAAETWPWEEDYLETLRERTWPYLYEKMPDQAEAAEWRQKIEAEAARLDAAVHRAS